MRRVYLDNAATSFPKPPAVLAAMTRYALEVGAPARGMYAEAREAGGIVDDARRAIAEITGAGLWADGTARHVVFTLNTSDALNMAIRGVVGFAAGQVVQGAGRARGVVHVVTTAADHNSVLRPMSTLAARSIAAIEVGGEIVGEVGGVRVEVSRVGIDARTGLVDVDELSRVLRAETALVAVNHASNVTGVVQDVGAIARVVRARCDGLYLVDAAQSLGHVPFDMRAMDADLVAFPGHKGLLGPTGTGGLVIRPGVERRMVTVREGGTGWLSELEAMPEQLPERFEPGSHNTIGIAGLGAGVRWLLARGALNVMQHEARLTSRLLAGLAGVPGLRVLGPGVLGPVVLARELSESSVGGESKARAGAHGGGRLEAQARAQREAQVGLGKNGDAQSGVGRRVGVVSFVHAGVTPTAMSAGLEARFGVISRSGLHCAPLLHAALGTGVSGATRLSVGPFNTDADVDVAVQGVRELCGEAGRATARVGGVEDGALAREPGAVTL